MYGDTQVIRRLAGQMRERGVEVREAGDRLVAEAEAASWHGRSAEAMRNRMADRAAYLRKCADAHEEAAAALEAHAREVDELKERIAWVASQVGSLVEGAKSRLASARSLLPDPVDEMLAKFVPPAPGHMDWLDVPDRLPGVFR